MRRGDYKRHEYQEVRIIGDHRRICHILGIDANKHVSTSPREGFPGLQILTNPRASHECDPKASLGGKERDLPPAISRPDHELLKAHPSSIFFRDVPPATRTAYPAQSRYKIKTC